MGKLKRVEIPTISSTRFDCDLENHDRQSHNRMKKKMENTYTNRSCGTPTKLSPFTAKS